jgi:hypothetical protein
MQRLQQSWVQSRHLPTHWKLKGCGENVFTFLHNNSVLRIRVVYLGSQIGIFPFGSRIQGQKNFRIPDPGSRIPDPGPHKIIEVFITQIFFSKLRKYDPGCYFRIPDPDFLSHPGSRLRIPDPEVKKSSYPGSRIRIRNTA